MSGAEVNRRWTEAVNRHDAAAAAQLYAPNAVVHDPQYDEPLEGRDAVEKDFRDFFAAFPDLTFTTGDVLEDGNRLAGDGRFAGTHQGVLVTEQGDLPPTGRRVDLPGCSIVRLDGQGRILEERRYYDLARLFQQLEITV